MLQDLNEEFFTIPEAAKLLKVSVSTVWRWIDSGALPAYRIGQRRIRIKKAELQTIIQPIKTGLIAQAKPEKKRKGMCFA